MKGKISQKLLEAAYAFDLDEVRRLVRNGVRCEDAFLSDLGGTLIEGDPDSDIIFARLQAKGLQVKNENDALFELYRVLLESGHPVPDGSSRRCVVRVIFGAPPQRFAQAAPLMDSCLAQDMLDWTSASWAHQIEADKDDGKLTGRTPLGSPHDLLADAVALLAGQGNVAGLQKVCALLPKDVQQMRKWLSGGSAPLCKAACEGQLESMRFLLTLMPEPSWRDVGFGGKSAFHSAALTGQAEVVRFLMDEHGCSLQDPESGNLLAGAIQNRHDYIVPQLLAWGCDPNNITDGEPTALHMAIWMDKGELVAPLLAAGNRVDILDKAKMTPLLVAGMVGMASAVAPLVDAGSQIEALDSQGRTALAWAAGNDRLETAKALVAVGASLDIQDLEGVTPRARAKGATRAWVWESGLDAQLPAVTHRPGNPRF